MAEIPVRKSLITITELEKVEPIKEIAGYVQNSKVKGGLRISFDVERRLSASGDTATVRIWNLSAASRAQIAQRSMAFGRQGNIRYVRIEAGYDTRSGVIFNGAVVTCINRREGPDWITEITASTAIGQALLNTVDKSWGSKAGTDVTGVVRELFEVLRYNTVTFSDKAKEILQGKKLTTQVVTGSAYEAVRRLLSSYKLVFTLNVDGAVVTLPGYPINTDAIEITEKSGLLGTPQVKHMGASFKVALDARIHPGRLIHVESQTVIDSLTETEDLDLGYDFTVWEVTVKGDTHTADWFCEIDAWYYPPLVENALPIVGGTL